MSTVVGLKTDKGIWIGCDSRVSNDDGEIRPIMAQKIFINGPYLIAGIGSVRGIQILYPEYFTPPKSVINWPDILLKHFEEKSCVLVGDQNITIMACNFLIGDSRTGKLYEILIDFQMNEISNITAIGAGSSYAFGSLSTTRELNINDGEKRVRLALESAAEFNASTGSPFIIKKLSRNNKRENKIN